MDLVLSLATLNILAWSKVVFFVYGTLMLFFILKIKKPLPYLLLNTLAILIFYVILFWPLKRMWSGNVGDELFIADFLAKVLLDNPWRDFYYGYLPNFYPPLYFWITGLISRPFAHNAIVASKIGIALAMLVFFSGSYFWQDFFWKKVNKNQIDKKDIVSSGWFLLLLPLLYFIIIGFDSFVFKPYEALSALLGVILMGIISKSFFMSQWTKKHYLFIGLSGGLLFLLFYFWWLIFIPAILVLVMLSKNKKLNFKRAVYFSLIIAAISLVFVGPLFWSYFKYGIENGQAMHFVVLDFFTFAPWRDFSFQGLLYLLGLVGLIFFYKKSFVKASLVVLVICYAYQFLNIIYFLIGQKPAAASKPYFFLGSAAIAVGLTYLFIYIYQKYIAGRPAIFQKSFFIIIFLLFLSKMPFADYIDNQNVLAQIEKDLLEPTQTIALAEAIKENVPDYKERTWLSSGSMELGAYLPLSYYIAPSIHFSHHASGYSFRMSKIEEMTLAKNPEEFIAIIDSGTPQPVDTLLFYNPYSGAGDYYNLYFWVDNYPNGGKDKEMYLPKSLIIDKYWQEVYNKDNWIIFLRK